MLFDDQFVNAIRSDPIAKVIDICRIASGQILHGQGWTPEERAALLEAYLLLVEVSTTGMLPFNIHPPTLPDRSNLTAQCSVIAKYLVDVNEACAAHTEQLEIEQIRGRLRSGLGIAFTYEFSQGDLERVQSLVNDLRHLISSESIALEADHKRRLLKRLESLQSELHKRMSDLDRFWGLVGDAGVVLGKLGTDAKPIIERVREIADIVWRTQGRAEELPSGAKPPQIGYDAPDEGADA